MNAPVLSTIRLGERFDFNGFRAFRDAYEAELARPELSTLVIDLSSVKYIDSSAIGILLSLRKKAAEVKKEVELYKPQGVVHDVLHVTNLLKLFKVTE